MSSVRVLDVLQNDLLCNHKLDVTNGMPYHNHNGYELFLFIRGCVNYYTEDEGLRMSSGDLICIKPYVFHRREPITEEPFERYILNLTETYMNKLCTPKSDLSSVFFRPLQGTINRLHLTDQQVRQYTYLFLQISRNLNSDDFGADLLVESYLKQLLVLINRIAFHGVHTVTENIMPSIVSGTITYIDEHLTEKITLEILSRYLHHNGTYIGRCFKRITGISLQQYIIGKRISLAEKYLLEGHTLTDACYYSGFNDYTNFCRTFTKEVGISPKKFQQSGLEQAPFSS